ncbi:hypothetical protein ACWEPC_49370, partial [Nonomuraea sp. NPDC004297]
KVLSSLRRLAVTHPLLVDLLVSVLITAVTLSMPYPRTEEVRLSPEFARIRNEVWHSVYHQAPAA